MKTQQSELWEGIFGDLYQERNEPTEQEVSNRLSLFENIYKIIYMNCGAVPLSILEVGAGQGPNMMALEKLSQRIEKPIKLYTTEINEKARVHLKENCPNVEILHEIPREPTADLVFTYGVLIHTHPAHVKGLTNQIYGASKRWISAVEYFAPCTRMIPYRGEKEALWLDDYGSKYLDNYPLRVIGYGFCWKRNTGLDNVTAWTFEKIEKMQ